MKPKILIVDDEEDIRVQMRWALSEDYELSFATNEKETLEILKREEPNLVALDLILSPHSERDEGFRVLEYIMQNKPYIKVIMITGNEERQKALKAMDMGAFYYYVKPIDLNVMKIIIKIALDLQKLEEEKKELTERLQQQSQFEEMVGSSSCMEEVFDTIRKVAGISVTVLITGESGTGKELVARAIHYISSRKDKPFIPINCGAIPENLLESELFGYEKGAFTGAYFSKEGKFEAANHGTIFLDEIGELSLPLQVKLLRFLEEQKIERVGGNKPIQLNVRIIAATNKNLEEELKNENFREDLYYRLSVINIFLPPLREREGDIPLLANFFLHKFSREYHKRVKGFTKEAIEAIEAYPWPGNVRELENKIKRAVIMADSPLLTAESLDIKEGKKMRIQTLKEAKRTLEARYIYNALMRNRSNITAAASEIGLSRPAFYDLMKKHKIKIPSF